MRLATIITDASTDSSTGASGWAGRVIFEGRRTTYSGPIRRHCRISNDAEIMAFCNTLHQAFAKGDLPEDVRLIVQIDNERARAAVRYAFGGDKTSFKFSNTEHQAVRIIKDIVRKFSISSVDVRHVKAHKKRDQREAKHHVHEAMDKLAKQGMREARAKLQEQVGA